MLKLSRPALAVILFAGAGLAVAQPPGPGRPGGPEKKDFPRREAGERKDADRPKGPESLERELQMLRARQAEIEAQLRKAREGNEPKRDEPKREEPRREEPKRGPDAPRGGFGGPGGFPPFARGPMGPGGPGFGGPGMNLPLENMSPEQIKQLIGRLQQALEAKTRGDQPKKPEGNKGDQPKKPEGNKGDQPKPSQEDVLKRLERLNRELDEIRRSLGK